MTRSPTATDAVRAFSHEDAPAVATMFEELLGAGRADAGSDLVDHLRWQYLEGPFAAPDCPALVHVGADGLVAGFGGRVVQPFAFGGRVVRGAILGNLMVRDHRRTPMAGAALLRALAGGPQDLTLSETAGAVTLAMWQQLQGRILDRHSLDYLRILKPVSALLEMAASRVGAARFLLPLAAPMDGFASRRRRTVERTGLPAGFTLPRGIRTQAVSPDAFAGIFEQLTRGAAGVPVWPGDCLSAVVAEASTKRACGAPHLRAVLTPGGAPIGAFLFHLSPTGLAQVTELVHAPGRAGVVLDALFADARDLGASYVRGRTRPQMLEALLSRKTFFICGAASVIRATDPDIADAFMRGDVHFNGLVGEQWTRFIGDTFAQAASGRPAGRPSPRDPATGLAPAAGARLET